MSSSRHRSSSFAASSRCVYPARSRIFCSSLNDGGQVILGPTEDYMPREEVLRKVTDVDAIICHGKDKADAEVPGVALFLLFIVIYCLCCGGPACGKGQQAEGHQQLRRWVRHRGRQGGHGGTPPSCPHAADRVLADVIGPGADTICSGTFGCATLRARSPTQRPTSPSTSSWRPVEGGATPSLLGPGALSHSPLTLPCDTCACVCGGRLWVSQGDRGGAILARRQLGEAGLGHFGLLG